METTIKTIKTNNCKIKKKQKQKRKKGKTNQRMVVINNNIKNNRRTNSGRNNNSFVSLYTTSVLNPELKIEAKIPSLFPLPTISVHSLQTVQFAVGASGNFNYMYRPVYCQDSANPTTTFYFNPNCNFDGVTTSGYMPGVMQAAIPVNTASAYRLVSASIHLTVIGAPLTLKGRIGSAIHTDDYNGTPVPNNTPLPGFNVSTPEYNTIAISQNSMHYAETSVVAGAALRSIYLPFDPSFLVFLPINKRRADMSSSTPDEFAFIGYGAGLNPGDLVQFKVYLNYEFEPHGTAFPLSIANKTTDKISAEAAVAAISQKLLSAVHPVAANTSQYSSINSEINRSVNFSKQSAIEDGMKLYRDITNTIRNQQKGPSNSALAELTDRVKNFSFVN